MILTELVELVEAEGFCRYRGRFLYLMDESIKRVTKVRINRKS
jgi:hypothetical protein